MRRALPFVLFALLTLLVFWRFIFLGHTLYVVETVETMFDEPERPPLPWFRSMEPHGRPADNVLLLPLNLRIYNEGLKSGELRLWNPGLFCGYPIYSDPMVHPFYPPHLVLHLLLPPQAAFGLSLLLHFFFSGVAMYAALRALGRSSVAATTGAVVWMLFGYNAAWFSTAVLLGAGVFGPLAVAAVARGLERRDLGLAAPAALAMGMAILGTHPQHALHLFVFLLAWVAWAAWRERENRAFAARFGVVFAVLSVGVGLAAVLTRLETIAEGYRLAGRDLDVHYRNPGEVLTHALGLVLGKAYFPESPSLEFDFCVYSGLAAAALAGWGAWKGARETSTGFVALFAGGCLAAAFLSPLATLLARIPLMNLSPPARWIFIFGLCLSILSARGLDGLAGGVGRLPHALAGATATLLVACMLSIGPFRLSNGAAIETLIGFALAAGAAWVARTRPAAGVGLGLAALLFELVPHFFVYNRHVEPAVLERQPEAVRHVRERERGPWRGTGGLGSVFSRPDALFAPELTVGNNMLAWYGAENVAGFEAIMPDRYVRFCSAAGGQIQKVGRSIAFVDFGSPLLDAAALDYVFMPFGIKMPTRFTPVEGEFGPVKLYHNTTALPRAYFARRVMLAADADEALRLISSPTYDPHVSTILEAPAAPPALSQGSVSWTSRLSDRVSLRLDVADHALLVLADAFYPGWSAFLDGAPVPLLPANLAFRAVAIPPGSHTLEMRFRPSSARVGLSFSALFALAALGWTARDLFRRRHLPG